MNTLEQLKTAYNSTYKKLAVQWLHEALCFVSSSVVADSFSLRNRQLLVAAKRYCKAAWGTTREEIDSVCLAFFTDRQAPRNLTA